MRILFVSPTAQAGTPQYTHNLMNALAAQGKEVALITSVGYELARYPRSYHLLEVFDRYRIHPGRIYAMFRFIRRFRPQIIHFQGAQRPATYLATWFVLHLLSPARFVYTPQDILPFKENSHHVATLRSFYRRMEHVFLNARQNLEVARNLFQASPSNITILPIPDLLAFLREGAIKAHPPSIPREHRLLLFFGQIQQRKGVDVLIEAFAQLYENHPDTHLAIVGKPFIELSPMLERIEELGIGDRITIRAEYVDFEEMAGYFDRAHLVVLPYRHGWNSGVLASAFGYHKPVVATRVGGFDEIVRDHYNGLLCPPQDVSALRDALSRCLADAQLYRNLVKGAEETARKHSWKNVAATTLESYQAVLDGAQT